MGLYTMYKIDGSARERASPFKVYPAGKLHWHFTCGFDFRHSLRLPIVAILSVSKGLNTSDLKTIFVKLLFTNSAL